MKIIILLFIFMFSFNCYATKFTLTGSTQQESSIKKISKIYDGYSVYCDFTVMPTSVDLKIFLGNEETKQTEAASITLTTVDVHGLEATTYSSNAKVVIVPTGGSFTAVCFDNQ